MSESIHDAVVQQYHPAPALVQTLTIQLNHSHCLTFLIYFLHFWICFPRAVFVASQNCHSYDDSARVTGSGGLERRYEIERSERVRKMFCFLLDAP